MICLTAPIVALYAITAAYFAGVMVRLMLTLTPVVCVLSAIAFSESFSYCLQDEKPTQKSRANSVDGSVESSTDTEENNQNGPEKNSHKNLYDKVIIFDFFN